MHNTEFSFKQNRLVYLAGETPAEQPVVDLIDAQKGIEASAKKIQDSLDKKQKNTMVKVEDLGDRLLARMGKLTAKRGARLTLDEMTKKAQGQEKFFQDTIQNIFRSGAQHVNKLALRTEAAQRIIDSLDDKIAAAKALEENYNNAATAIKKENILARITRPGRIAVNPQIKVLEKAKTIVEEQKAKTEARKGRIEARADKKYENVRTIEKEFTAIVTKYLTGIRNPEDIKNEISEAMRKGQKGKLTKLINEVKKTSGVTDRELKALGEFSKYISGDRWIRVNKAKKSKAFELAGKGELNEKEYRLDTQPTETLAELKKMKKGDRIEMALELTTGEAAVSGTPAGPGGVPAAVPGTPAIPASPAVDSKQYTLKQIDGTRMLFDTGSGTEKKHITIDIDPAKKKISWEAAPAVTADPATGRLAAAAQIASIDMDKRIKDKKIKFLRKL